MSEPTDGDRWDAIGNQTDRAAYLRENWPELVARLVREAVPDNTTPEEVPPGVWSREGIERTFPVKDAIRPEAIAPLSADEEMRLRAEAESEKDHENKRHARWQRLVLRLLATLDAARRQRDEIEAEAADQINGIRAERAARVPVSEGLREALWNACPHQGKYGDDGEMQCGGTDFRRDPPEVLGHHVREAITECLAALAERGTE